MIQQKAFLNTFVLVNKDRVISPVLTTTREYGDWLEKVFDSAICNPELYMKSVKKDGERTLEKHPGTRIGNFFDKTPVRSNDLKSWFILQESAVMERLVKLKLAELKDAIPISVNDEQGRKMLRLYTANQIELYIRTKIDPDFHINDYLTTCKQVKISDEDLKQIIKPEVTGMKKKKLF